MSCSNARIISANILKALCSLEPKHKAFFEKNYQSLLRIINRRDSTIRMSFQKNPEMVRKFVIYHPILTYFARDYKLEQLAIEEEGREPSVAQLKSLIERAKKEKINTASYRQSLPTATRRYSSRRPTPMRWRSTPCKANGTWRCKKHHWQYKASN